MAEQDIIIKGFKFAGAVGGIKKSGKKDLGIIFSERPATVSGVFTSNKVKAASVLLDQKRIKSGICQAVIINSGNANACTGSLGLDHAGQMTKTLAEALGISDEQVLVASTGVIGELLPIERIKHAIPGVAKGLKLEGVQEFAESIITTDSCTKVSFQKETFGDKEVVLCGVAKGAGMICPDLKPPSATMLAFVMTDASVNKKFLDKIFLKCVENSFNSITVDGDMSTNDTVLILANGLSGAGEIDKNSPEASKFEGMLQKVLLDLAKMIVKDGEGATKLVEIHLKGAKDKFDAKLAAHAIANSLLVKTAFFGSDPNWGRIIAAVGYSGAVFDPKNVNLFYDDLQVVKQGTVVSENVSSEAEKIVKKREFKITVDLAQGAGQATVYTSDLSYDYVKINADYRT